MLEKIISDHFVLLVASYFWMFAMKNLIIITDKNGFGERYSHRITASANAMKTFAWEINLNNEKWFVKRLTT